MKKLSILTLLLSMAGVAAAQSPVDAFTISQTDLKGTARFMSMAGAFGALGGDLSTLSQNPAGIGVYRSSDLGFTVDLDCQQATATTPGVSHTMNQTKFLFNNAGVVGTMRLNSKLFPNFNVGFSYNRAASFNRAYSGGIRNLPTSLSNYIAGLANTNDLYPGDLESDSGYDPYNPPAGLDFDIPWITVLGYDAYLIDADNYDPDSQTPPHWYGQYGNGTTGRGSFSVNERGYLDEYNIVLGGNINNIVMWGMNFCITSLEYNIASSWGEDLQNAYVFNPNTQKVGLYDSQWRLQDQFALTGAGFNYQLGVIVKPIQELRLGLAFHTPTFYNLTETYYNERINFKYPFEIRGANGYPYNEVVTNDGIPDTNSLNFNSPWRVIASAAGVIGSNFIISADYEWNGYKDMNYSAPNAYYGWDDYYGYPWWDEYSGAPSYSYNSSPYKYTNDKIKKIYCNSSTIRLGAEFRVTPKFSVRAGYSYTSSPVTSEAKDGMVGVPGAGVLTHYRLDNSTNYVTCGLGYRTGGFYIDAAYVYKHISSEYHPFSPDPAFPDLSNVGADLSLNNSQVVVSMGYRF